ncbi:MAG: nitrilase-related carbon-nitrogen hydrolase, partial [Burkholderiaceae bacterium]
MSSSTLRVAACQMVSGTELKHNLATASRLVAQAADAGAQLIALPEYFCLMGRHERDKVAVREAEGNGPLQDFLAEQAARHGVWLVGGTIPLAAPDPARVLNTTLVFDPAGTRVARYDKMHLFAFQRDGESYDEARTIAPGHQVSSFEIAPAGGPRIKLGLSVCYDLRFPELYRRQQEAGAELLLVPAAWPAARVAHWTLLGRARAVE